MATHVYFFQDNDQSVPALDWLRSIDDQKVKAQFGERINTLEDEGHEMERPGSGHIKGGINELRVKKGRVNFRILYGLCKNTSAVLLLGCTKEQKVDPEDIRRAQDRLGKFESDPERYKYCETKRFEKDKKEQKREEKDS